MLQCFAIALTLALVSTQHNHFQPLQRWRYQRTLWGERFGLGSKRQLSASGLRVLVLTAFQDHFDRFRNDLDGL